MRRSLRHLVVCAAAALAVPTAVAAGTAEAALVPDDTLACDFNGSATAWSNASGTFSNASLSATARCTVDEKDGSPARATYPADFTAWGEFIGGEIAAYCLHGMLDGNFRLDVRNTSRTSTIESHSGTAQIQFGYGASYYSPTLGFYDTGSAPGHIQLAGVTDADGHWGGSAEGVIQVTGLCPSSVAGAFVLHI